jgi:16S rRNA (uracil1498-N3)-methyltransferase
MASLFFNEHIGGVRLGASCRLSGAEARHAMVNRLRPGEIVSVGDGAGTIATGPVTVCSAERVEIRADEVRHVARPAPRIGLAQALAKGGRDEMAVQAATELGVDVIVPWSAGRSVARWEGAKKTRGRERWGALAREASKQSMRAWVPEVAPVHTLDDLAGQADAWQLVVLDPVSTTSLPGWLRGETRAASYEPARDLLLVVGPEGGLDERELAYLENAGAVRVRLGSGILRTSTAGPAAIAVVNACGTGRW